MPDTELIQQNNMGGIVSNSFGECSLFSINRNQFRDSDASTVFRNYYNDIFTSEDTFYIIVGTDSGLLYQYIKSCGVPKRSCYLFVELPQVLALLNDIDDSESGLSVTNEEDWQECANDMDMMNYSIQKRLVLHRSLGVIHGHCDAYSPLWHRIQDIFDSFMEKQENALNEQPFILRQIENLTENQVPATCLRGTFNGKTAVILAGGPSLDELLPWVQHHRKNLLVITVSRISHTLKEANIQPDIIVSVDPNPINLYISRDMLSFQDNTLLVNYYHLSSNMLSSWGGRKVYFENRYPWAPPLEAENFTTIPGIATVTNVAVCIAVESGAKQLILGGVDFCFSQNGYTHASGSAEHALGPRPLYGNKRAITNSGKMADTDHAFMNSGDSLGYQAALASKQGCLFINPAQDAMRLPHVEHLPQDLIEIEPLERPAREIIANSLPTMDSDSRTKHYQETLEEVTRVQKELRYIKELSLNALKYNRTLNNQNKKAAEHATVKLDRIEKQIKTKYAETISFMNNFGIRRLISIIRHNEQHSEDRAGNNQLYFQAMIDTSTELTEALRRARRRILCRLEEEKPQPNMQCIFTQWREDKQTGRAIQWAHNHRDAVTQLPAAELEELLELQNNFDKYVEKLGQHYLKQIEKGLDLDCLNARAREYFQCQDSDGLHRLLNALKELHDPDQAQLYISLVEGYLAELHNKPEAAINAYQKTPKGPAYTDALMRCFELHTKANDLTSSLTVLKSLSQITSAYSPMYADLLKSTGDVETAVNTYTEYLLENPDDLNSMMKLGKIFHEHGEAKGVEWTMNYILGKDPDNETAKTMLKSSQQAQATSE